MNKSLIIMLVCGAFAAMACKEANTVVSNPPGYDLTKPQRFNMPDNLLEISGITFKNGNPDTVYTEQDEAGKVYRLRLGDSHAIHTEFAKPGDFEDIAIDGQKIVMLRSDGRFYSFPLNQVYQKQASHVNEVKNILPDGEYESLCADGGKLYLLAKHSSNGKQTKQCYGYVLSANADGSVISKVSEFSVDVQRIVQLSGGAQIDFRPSALARSPLTHNWYILSSVNKMLVVADGNWQVKAVYPLNPAVFLQPEGIAFDKNNNLYISNEGDKLSAGNILKFKYQPAAKAH